MGEKSRAKSGGKKLGVKSEKCGVHILGGKSWGRKERGQESGKFFGETGEKHGKNFWLKIREKLGENRGENLKLL